MGRALGMAGATSDGPDGLLGPKSNAAVVNTSPRDVQFVLVAPNARKVAVVGDFNDWDTAHAAYQAQHRGGGVWSVTAPVPVGHHRYSFVVDDSVWVTDPTAPRVLDEDYGRPNSALVVGESAP
jgi:1,4-alpha-glucan branching enzyme